MVQLEYPANITANFSASRTSPEKPLLVAQFSASLGEWHVVFAMLSKYEILHKFIHATSHRKTLARPMNTTTTPKTMRNRKPRKKPRKWKDEQGAQIMTQ